MASCRLDHIPQIDLSVCENGVFLILFVSISLLECFYFVRLNLKIYSYVLLSFFSDDAQASSSAGKSARATKYSMSSLKSHRPVGRVKTPKWVQNQLTIECGLILWALSAGLLCAVSIKGNVQKHLCFQPLSSLSNRLHHNVIMKMCVVYRVPPPSTVGIKPAAATSSTFDLLGSILQGQSMLSMKSDDVTINRDGE